MIAPGDLAEIQALIDAANAAADAALVEKARRSLLSYVMLHNPAYIPGWVHRDICRRLKRFSDDVAAKRSPRLIIAMPPRHGKSEIVSRSLPPWHLGRHPTHEVVVASYAADLAHQMTAAARARAQVSAHIFPALNKPPYRRGRRPKDTDAYWQTAAGGSCSGVGVGGPLTGKGANLLIIDDPLKGMADADSPTIRRKLVEWYGSTARTRLAPGGGVIVMATRWRTDDLTGHLLSLPPSPDSPPWEVVSYPAIADADEEHRRVGEALCPERYDLAALRDIRATLSPRAWAAMYQQRPTVEEGGLFRRDWFTQRYALPPKDLGCTKVWISVDATFKDSSSSDYVAIQVWGRKGASFYLLKRINARMSYVGLKQALRDVIAEWPEAITKIVEDKANGPALISELRKEVPGIVAYNPRASKRERAEIAAVPLYAASNVWLPSPHIDPTIGEYVEQHVGFLGGAAHDDEVDATAQALLYELRMSSLGAS